MRLRLEPRLGSTSPPFLPQTLQGQPRPGGRSLVDSTAEVAGRVLTSQRLLFRAAAGGAVPQGRSLQCPTAPGPPGASPHLGPPTPSTEHPACGQDSVLRERTLYWDTGSPPGPYTHAREGRGTLCQPQPAAQGARAAPSQPHPRGRDPPSLSWKATLVHYR